MRSRLDDSRVTLSIGQIAVRLLAFGGAGLLVGAVLCFYAFSAMFGGTGSTSVADGVLPLSFLLLGASVLAVLAGAILGLVSLVRRGT